MVVSAASSCQCHLYTSERAVPEYPDLTESGLHKRYYRQVQYITNMLVPVRLSVRQTIAYAEDVRFTFEHLGILTVCRYVAVSDAEEVFDDRYVYFSQPEKNWS